MNKDEVRGLITETIGMFSPKDQERILKRKAELEGMTPETLRNLAKSAMKKEFKAHIEDGERIINGVFNEDYAMEFYILSLIRHEQFKFQRELQERLDGKA